MSDITSPRNVSDGATTVASILITESLRTETEYVTLRQLEAKTEIAHSSIRRVITARLFSRVIFFIIIFLYYLNNKLVYRQKKNYGILVW